MSYRNVIAILGLIGICAFIAIGYGMFWMYTESSANEYRYECRISVNESIRNVTVFIPLPHGPHADEIVDAIAEGNFTGSGDGRVYTILEADDFTMLKVTAPVILPPSGIRPEPVSPDHPVVIPSFQAPGDQEEGFLFSVAVTASHPPDTVSPQGREPLLMPREQSAPATCTFPYPAGSPVQCSAYGSRLYADYQADANATVTIGISLTGSSQHWMLGWSSESYRDEIFVTLQGEHHGWEQAEGKLVQGMQ